MKRGLYGRPPIWALLVIALGLAVLAVGVWIARHRGAVTAAANAGVAQVEETIGAQSTPAARVLVIGDSYTGGSDQGGRGAAGWPELLVARLAATGHRAQVVVSAAGGGGYVALGPSGNTLVSLAQQAEPGYTLVIFFGSRNDVAKQADVQSAAAQAFAAVKATSPTAKLLVIGPPWKNSTPPGNVTADRDAVQAAAQAAGATFVDPLRDDWFGGPYQSMIGADGVHPTDAGHKHMADLILPRVEQLLPAS